jgi:cytochrome c oxidase cbb3-type subunit 2
MTFKSFITALGLSFGIPWLLIILVPFGKMRNLDPVYFESENDGKDEVYVPRRSGLITTGSSVYGSNGCYICHTQLIRAGYAGSELGRADWAGFQVKDENGVSVNTARETTPFDYVDEPFAHIGLMRIGPDLTNVAGRIQKYLKEPLTKAKSPESWLYLHLFNSSLKTKTLNNSFACPPQPHFFKEQPVHGQGSPHAVPSLSKEGREVLPTPKAKALVSYLLSLRKDDAVPYSLNYSRDKKKAD